MHCYHGINCIDHPLGAQPHLIDTTTASHIAACSDWQIRKWVTQTHITNYGTTKRIKVDARQVHHRARTIKKHTQKTTPKVEQNHPPLLT